MQIDFFYLCKMIGNLSGIPIRIYHNKRQTFYYSLVNLPQDPIVLYEKEILSIKEHIGYFATEQFYYYGILNAGTEQIVIGPSRQIPATDQELRELAFHLDVPKDDKDAFILNMKAIIHMPLESILQMMCTVNYIVNEEKLTLEDISIYDTAQAELRREFQELEEEKTFDMTGDLLAYAPHNTMDTEQALLEIVEQGDAESLKKWFKQAPAIRGGILATNQIRQMQNTFIVTATLISRAAIKGGMLAEDALQLSDAYIQKSECLNSPDRIMNLQYHMVLDFTERVQHLRGGHRLSPLTNKVANYIEHHLSEAITTEAIAQSLYMSRSHLSRSFKAETGEQLSDYIMRKKIEAAKKLLLHSDKTLAAISLYLGFSSQSHFSKVFKTLTGESPSSYRKKSN